jgi:SAM-dependent methyltransferase
MKEALGTYLDLCTQVYDLSKPTPPPDAYALYHTYASEAKGPILEPMCGTGRFLLPLIEDGFDVHGFDASSHMLQALREKAKARDRKPKVWQGFLEDLNRPDKFGLVLIPSGSFGLLVDRARARDALVRIYDHISDDGLLVFEADTPLGAPAPTGMWKGSLWPTNDGKTIVCNFLDLPSQDNVSTTVWRYELIDGAQIVRTEIEIMKVRQYDPADVTSMLMDVGFKNTVTFKAFDRTRCPQEGDEVIVYECRK